MVDTYDNTRRDALKYLAAGMAISTLPGLAACSRSDSGRLRFFGTATLDIGQANWQRAKDALGATIEFTDNGNDVGPVLAQMINGDAAIQYDLGGVQGGAEPEMYKAQTILPWDLEKIPNWAGVWDWMKEIPYLNDGGRQIGIPLAANADSMIYLEDETGLIDSYAAIFDPKLKGRTAMEDSWMNSVIFTAIYMKENNIEQMGQISEPGDLTEFQLGTVIEFLKKHKRDGQFRTFWSGWTEGRDLIVNREVSVMTGWEPIFYAARDMGIADVRYAVPVEGYEGWSNNLVLHKGSADRGNVDLAHEFANWLLDGWYGCVLGGMRGYVVPNRRCIEAAAANPVTYENAEKSTTDSMTEDAAVALVERVENKFSQQKGRIYWQNARPKLYQQYERGWAELRAI